MPGGVLANLAPLTGASTSYAVTVAQVSDDDREDVGASAVSSGASCSTSGASSVLSLVGCAVELGTSQSASATGVAVSVSFGSLGATVSFDVYTPQATSLTLVDSTLNRISPNGGGSLTACTSSGVSAYPYQRTRALAYADSLDVTSLVSFGLADTSVAGVSSASYDLIEGKQSCSTTVHLGCRLGSAPQATVTVTDTTVSVWAIFPRLVTHVEWNAGGQPSSQYATGDVVSASIKLRQSLRA